MNTNYDFSDIYNDFFGVESKNINKEEVTSKDISYKDLIDKIDNLYLNSESKNLLKKIVEYMRKYNEKIENNYITFNISLEGYDKDLIKNIEDILIDSSALYKYVDKNRLSIISLYDVGISELDKAYEQSGVISIKDINGIYLKDTNEQIKFIHSFIDKLKFNNITFVSGNKDEINRLFEDDNIKDNFIFNLVEEKPSIQQVNCDILNKVNLNDKEKIELLDYISKDYINSDDSYTNYVNRLVNYISFNKEIPKLENTMSMDEIFKELNELVGLDDIKKTLYDLVDLISLKDKTKDKLKLSNINLHMVFLGNPGTGKTTVARIIANILYNLKYIKTNKLIEVTSKDLVAEYVGQTAPKTNSVIERALGGVLFIDEAYALSSKNDSGNSYNAEAIATLIAAMENHRDDLVVIFAGYTKEMQDFLDSNSGIVSRIGYTLNFKDYSEDELVDIFKLMTNKAGFVVKDDAIDKLREVIREYKDTKNFGNARFIRNVYEKTVIKHASNTKDKKSIKLLSTITKDDISIDNILKDSNI